MKSGFRLFSSAPNCLDHTVFVSFVASSICRCDGRSSLSIHLDLILGPVQTIINVQFSIVTDVWMLVITSELKSWDWLSKVSPDISLVRSIILKNETCSTAYDFSSISLMVGRNFIQGVEASFSKTTGNKTLEFGGVSLFKDLTRYKMEPSISIWYKQSA
jgi:hypothetical protein